MILKCSEPCAMPPTVPEKQPLGHEQHLMIQNIWRATQCSPFHLLSLHLLFHTNVGDLSSKALWGTCCLVVSIAFDCHHAHHSFPIQVGALHAEVRHAVRNLQLSSESRGHAGLTNVWLTRSSWRASSTCMGVVLVCCDYSNMYPSGLTICTVSLQNSSVGFSKRSCPVKHEVLSGETEVLSGETLFHRIGAPI